MWLDWNKLQPKILTLCLQSIIKKHLNWGSTKDLTHFVADLIKLCQICDPLIREEESENELTWSHHGCCGTSWDALTVGLSYRWTFSSRYGCLLADIVFDLFHVAYKWIFSFHWNDFMSAHLWRCWGRATAAPWHYFFCNVSTTLVWISYSDLRRERKNICQGEKQQNNWWKLLKKAHENQLVDYKWLRAKRKGDKIFQRRDTRVNFSRSSALFYICDGPTAF